MDDLLAVLLLVLQLVVLDVGGIFLTVLSLQVRGGQGVPLPRCHRPHLFPLPRHHRPLCLLHCHPPPRHHRPPVGAPVGRWEDVLAQARPGAGVEDGVCSNNLELIEDHTNSLVSVEAARVVLHQFAPVKPYFHLVSARSEARSHPSREFQPRLSVRGMPTVLKPSSTFTATRPKAEAPGPRPPGP